MQQPDTLRRVLQLGLGSAIALGVAPTAALAAGQAASQVGSASYDRAQERLTIPVKGGIPAIVVRRLAPRQYVADLKGSSLLGGEAQGQRLRSPALAGWSLDEEPGNKTVRLRMTLTTDVQPRVRFDRRVGGYVVTFTTPADEVAAKPAPKPVAVAAAPKPAAKPKAAWPLKPTKPAVTTTAAAKPAPAVKAPAPIAVKKTEAPALTQKEIAGRLAARRLPLTPVAAGQRKLAGPGGAPAPVAVKPTLVAVKPVVKPVVVAAKPQPRPIVKPIAARPAPVYATVTSTPVRAPRPEVHRTFVGTSTSATLGTPTWDAAHSVLVLPIEAGSLRAHGFDVYRLSARWSFIDIPHAKPAFSGLKYQERQDKFFQRWVMAKRPGRDTTRISFALGQPAHIDVEVAEHEVRIAVRPDTPIIGAAPASTEKPDAVLATAPVRPATQANGATSAARTAVKPLSKSAVKPTAVAQVAAEPINTHMRRPFYDAERFGLVIPYEGQTPMYRWRTKDEGNAVLELKADVVSPTHLQPDARRHGDFGSWTFGRPARPGLLAIDMSFARPSEIVVAADPERKQLLLIPQPRLQIDGAAATAPAHASLATVALDSTGDNLFIPFNGSVPRYTIEQVNPSFAYINFERAALSHDGVQFFAPDYHPTLNYWMVTQPTGTTTVRVAVALARPGAAAVFQDQRNGRLVINMGGDAPIGMASGARAPRVPEPWPGARKVDVRAEAS